MAKSSTVVGVQYLRGLAALLVVMDHTGSVMGLPEHFGRSPATFIFYGAVGVPIFFVISGFIIAVASLEAGLKPRLRLGEFYRRRFVRIVPFMWCCVLGYNLLRFAGTGALDWGPFIRGMTLWPIGDLRPNVLWTLRHELLFYALFGLTMLGAVRHWWILLVWFASPFLLCLVQLAVPGSLLLLPLVVQEWIGFIANSVNIHFGGGFVLGILYIRGSVSLLPRFKGGFPLAFALASSVFLILALSGLPLLALTNPPPTEFVATIVVSALCWVLVWFGICLRPGDGWVSHFGHFLGDASYSIYLVHNAVLLVILSAMARYPLSNHLWGVYAVLATAAIAGGCIVHVLVERPLVRVASRFMFGPPVTKEPGIAVIRG